MMSYNKVIAIKYSEAKLFIYLFICTYLSFIYSFIISIS